MGGLMLVCVGGCSTTATIYRRGGGQWEGKIVGGSYDTILVERNGQSWPIRRGEIRDVDHPGDRQALAGLSLVATSGIFLLGGACQRPSYGYGLEGDVPPECPLDLIGVGIGFAVGAWGLAVWQSSKAAYKDTSLGYKFGDEDNEMPEGTERKPKSRPKRKRFR